MKYKLLMIIMMTFVLSACMVGPNYQPPFTEVPEDWTSGSVAGESVDTNQLEVFWWRHFDDPRLSYYIEKSASCNHDVRIALTNICRSRAQCKIMQSYLYPEIESELRYNRNSFETFFGGLGLEFEQNAPNLPTFTTNTQQKIFFAGLDAFWELDLFGQTRRQVEAAAARIGSSVEDYHDVLITVFGEVAKNYFQVRSLQEMISVVEEKILNLEEYLNLVKQKKKAGISNKIDVNDISVQLEDQKSVLPPLIADLYTAVYRLSFLVGVYPWEILEEMQEIRPLPSVPQLVKTGLPSELLQRRPDIRRAERELAAATADVGAAIADFFPKINLSGSIGNQDFWSKAFKDNGFVWSYTGDLLSPIFRGGRIKANVKSRKADAKIAFLLYEQSVLQAIEETESAVVAYQMSLDNLSISEKRYLELRETADLKTILYKKGVDNKIIYLNAQNQMLEARRTFVQNQTDSLLKVVTLYKSLGGGWEICF